MKKVYKYPVPICREFSLKLPIGANILAFQTQDRSPCIWAMVDIDADVEERNFMLLGTGHPIDSLPTKISLSYIGTTQYSVDPPLVWHLFEKVKS